MKQHAVFDSPLGPLTAVENDAGLAAVYMADHKRRPGLETLGPQLSAADSPVLAATIEQLGEYFHGGRKEFSLPLSPLGSVFAHRVWEVLRSIGYGELRTYSQVAALLGNPAMAQAVGAANSRNPLSIIVPCHRVVGAAGSLVGYAGGMARKQFLLELEDPSRVQTAPLF
ncbi:methylated-DNA--[protein]-cysteine S-methyltransferase [Specibacter sp. NPDC057265]|uniref:methylated-DNA--[protein]-cysteine S-methyltransferase n=1 Tax=Specibacter sp. NPDC057265 TaxID=3346075 RepID=UPI00363709E1